MKAASSASIDQARTVNSLLRTLLRELSAGLDDPAIQLPLAQLRVCNVLSAGPRSMSSLGKELGVSLSAITQIADRLERAGLVTRVSQDNDRRVRCLQVTDRGARMMQRHDASRVERMAAALEQMTPKTREAVAAALGALARAATAARTGNGNGDGKLRGPHSRDLKVLL
jgi:DNA-binding MarR family transcriptional regulator